MPSTASPDKPLRIARLLAVIRRETGRDFDKAALLQTAGSLSEALSVAMLVPMLHLMASNANAVTIVVADQKVSLTLPVVLAVFVVLIVVRAGAMQRKETFNARVTYGFAESMTRRLFVALSKTRWSAVSRWRTADMAHALSGNGDRLLHAINLLLTLLQSVGMAIILTLLSLLLSWQMTLLALFVGVLVLAATLPIRRQFLKQGRQLMQARQEQARIADEFLNGLRTAKAFSLENQHVDAMRCVLADIRRGNIQFMVARANTTAIFQVASALALAVFVYLALSVAGLSLAKTVALLFLYMRLAPRIIVLHTATQELMVQIAEVEGALAMLETAERYAEIPALPNQLPIHLRRGIEVRNATYTYEGSERPAVLEIQALIPAGKVTAIVGPTGSGKSTLVDLILGLIQPDQGDVRIDGIALSGERLKGWQSQIGYVPQETFLFNTTIGGNLRLANSVATDAELWDALELADAADLVRSLRGELEHEVGDRGRWMSGGERQRLAIARALVRKPDLLILDEATSALDALSQRRIVDAIGRLRGSMSTLAIAHRPSMVAFADHVIVLEHGRVTGAGSFRQLVGDPDGHLRGIVDLEGKMAHNA